ncbi:hypothetical protein [Mesorhizobium sp.]|uniref:hypothetical protein n=1 Tax=Mesorhizobium sp. TaxID=1871066 RepID=UPI0012053CA5|nr:hypothetical protein [Mesorhizobium sp.]TIL38495.1 MAG: hypothetical protein E5Y82_13400 [Mesorhizobium sp.]
MTVGFPFAKLAPLPWNLMPGGTGIACSDEVGNKVCATVANHLFPERGERESAALAKEIVRRVNAHDALVAALEGLVHELERDMPNATDDEKGTAWLDADAALALARGGK